jgi:hypothetical protein
MRIDKFISNLKETDIPDVDSFIDFLNLQGKGGFDFNDINTKQVNITYSNNDTIAVSALTYICFILSDKRMMGCILELKEFLGEKGICLSFNTPHADGNSTFMEAIKFGNKSIVKYFLDNIALCGSDEAVSEAEKINTSAPRPLNGISSNSLNGRSSNRSINIIDNTINTIGNSRPPTEESNSSGKKGNSNSKAPLAAAMFAAGGLFALGSWLYCRRSDGNKTKGINCGGKIGATNILRKNDRREDAFAIALKHRPNMAAKIAQKQLEAGKTRSELLRDIEDSNIKCQDLKEELQKAEDKDKWQVLPVTILGCATIPGAAAWLYGSLSAAYHLSAFVTAVYTLTTAAAVAGLSYYMFTWRDSIENDLNKVLLDMSEKQIQGAEIYLP